MISLTVFFFFVVCLTLFGNNGGNFILVLVKIVWKM